MGSTVSVLITELIDKQIETANIDYKEGFEWTKESRDKRFELIKDILGMANTRDGGTIILGVKDDTRELVGVSRAIWDGRCCDGPSKEHAKSESSSHQDRGARKTCGGGDGHRI